LSLQDEGSETIHVLGYHSHGPDSLLDLGDYRTMAKKRALSLGVLGVDMNDGLNEAVGPGKAGFDSKWSYTCHVTSHPTLSYAT
jgi:hypothetical protein